MEQELYQNLYQMKIIKERILNVNLNTKLNNISIKLE